MPLSSRRNSYEKLPQQRDDIADENAEQQPNSALEDLLLALDDAKWIGSVVALVVAICMFNLLARDAPDSLLEIDTTPLEVFRPLLSVAQQHRVKHARMFARTNVAIRPDLNTTYHHHRRATKRGHLPLPDLFYRGVVFGVAAHNTHDILYMSTNSSDPLSELHDDLVNMRPRPTLIMDRYSFENETNWDEPGFAVFFDYEDLRTQGFKANDPQPWQHAERKIMTIARKYKQVCIYRWHPHRWGEGTKDNAFKHTTIVQDVLPTRTGLNIVRSTAIVYESDDDEDEDYDDAEPR